MTEQTKAEAGAKLAEARAYHSSSMWRVANVPAPEQQKYPPGTRVRIADDLGPSMRHFTAGVLATVKYTHAHAYGGKHFRSYCLDVDGYGECSWYEEHQLSPVDAAESHARALIGASEKEQQA